MVRVDWPASCSWATRRPLPPTRPRSCAPRWLGSRSWRGSSTSLQARRASMDPDAYQTALEDLLVEIALVDEEIRRLGGGG